MTNKQKIFLSLFALTFSMFMVVLSVSSAQAFSDQAKEGFKQFGEFKKEQIRERVQAAKEAANEVKLQQREETKQRVRKKSQERANQAREEFSQEHGWGNGEIRERVRIKGDEVAMRACERSRERYQKRLDFYQGIEDKYVTRYENAVSRVEGLLNKLEALGVDVTEARNKLETWTSKIDEAVASLRVNMDALESLANVDCNDPQAAREQVKAVRARLQETRTKAKEVRTYYQEEVKPALLDLKNQE